MWTTITGMMAEGKLLRLKRAVLWLAILLLRIEGVALDVALVSGDLGHALAYAVRRKP